MVYKWSLFGLTMPDTSSHVLQLTFQSDRWEISVHVGDPIDGQSFLEIHATKQILIEEGIRMNGKTSTKLS